MTCKASTCRDTLPLSKDLQYYDIPALQLVKTLDKRPGGWSMKDIPGSPSGLTVLLEPLLQHLRLPPGFTLRHLRMNILFLFLFL